MASREQYIEGIIENIHKIKRTMVVHNGNFVDASIKNITLSEWNILRVVLKNESIGVKEIAGQLGITSSAATQLINSLVSKNFLVRKSSSDDRRALEISLSEESRKQLDILKSKRVEKLSAIFDALDDKELESFFHLSKKISNGTVFE